jgi:Tfp pilus tip-associated adhesin PilY1
VDGPITAADVWWKEGKTGLGDKDGSEWKTLLIVSEGRGVRDQNGDTGFLWSSSIYCDQGFNKTYSDPYHFYCGYHALNVTETGAVSPTYLWRIRTWGVPGAAYLSEPWSRMAVGRVKIGGYEKWLGFIGGGLDGKGFFVIDLSSGDILWNYTKSNNADMDYGIPASPTVVDVDNDGFIDTAYVGDRGGNMWRFKFCMDTDGPTCNKSNWQGGLFFQAPTGQIRPIFTTAAVSKDNSGSLWVFWGTGDKLDPTSADAQEKFYALMLADPTVFGGIVLFTTYTPTTSGGDLCASGGDAKLYAMAMMSLVINGITYDPGAGVLSEGSPSNKYGGNKWVSRQCRSGSGSPPVMPSSATSARPNTSSTPPSARW